MKDVEQTLPDEPVTEARGDQAPPPVDPPAPPGIEDNQPPPVPTMTLTMESGALRVLYLIPVDEAESLAIDIMTEVRAFRRAQANPTQEQE